MKMLETIAAKVRHMSQHRILTYFDTPEVRASYPKQMQWFKLGKIHQECALFGGNRSGKTVAGTFADTLHLTGQYPDWWEGYRFDRPTEGWAAGDTGKNTRDILQNALLGKPGDEAARGTGMIPGDLILRTTPKHGIADAVETVFVRHVPTGGVSTLQFKSYDQGREAFQGTAQDFIHLDEEPDIDIYTECLLRLMTTDGRLELTATPLRGVTQLMLQFMPHLAPKTIDELEENYDEESAELL
jgi:phage terminase large subunit-like protein